MKSLDNGPSAIVPIKAPKGLRDLLKAWLDKGETISGLTRQLWQDEIQKRKQANKKGKK
jgi:hypothetical protein